MTHESSTPLAPESERTVQGGDQGLDVGTACRLLAQPVRRECLKQFIEDDEVLCLDGLIDRILRNRPATADPEIDREGLCISLTHVHLPALEVNGLITWDRERDRITYRGSEHVEELLDLFEKWER